MIKKIAINKALLNIFTYSQNLNDYIQIYSNLSEVRDKGSTFFFGTIEDCRFLQEKMFGSCSYFNLCVSDFVPFVQEMYVNFDGYYKQCCQLNSYDIGKFIRSDSGTKTWSGQLLRDRYELNFIKQQLQSDDLLYLSAPKWIRDECRYWIIGDRIVESCRYNNIFSSEYSSTRTTPFSVNYDQKYYDDFVNSVIKNWGPDEMYTIDVGLFGNDIYIIEYNCFSTSGFYNANVNQICSELIKFLNK